MGIPSDAPGFKKLMQEWYALLKATGFDDIEVLGDHALFIKRSGTHARFEQMTASEIQGRIDYFEFLKECVSSTTFDDDEEKVILTLFSEGLKQKEIEQRIGKHRSTVYKKLYKWLKKWKLK